VNVNNIAYRDWIAGDNNYDAYRLMSATTGDTVLATYSPFG